MENLRLQYFKKFLSPQTIVIFIFLLFSLLTLIFVYSHSVNLLFNDQYDYYDVLFKKKSIWTIFLQQSGSHRLGPVFIIDILLAEITKWNTRIEAVFVAILSIISCALALSLKKKLFKNNLQYSDIAIPAIFLSTVQFESFIVTPFPTIIFPVTLLVCYCLLWTTKESLLKYISVSIVNLILIYSGWGVLVGFITIFLFVCNFIFSTNKRFQFIILTCISIISLVVFYIGYNNVENPLIITPTGVLSMFPYAILLFGGFFVASRELLLTILGGLFSLYLSGKFLIKSLKHVLQKDTKDKSFYTVTFILFAFTFVYWCINTIGRSHLGPTQAYASRYSTFFIPALLGIYFSLIAFKNKIKIWIFVSVFVGLYVFSFSIPAINKMVTDKLAWKNCYLEVEDMKFCNNKYSFEIYPNSLDQGDLQYKLDYLKQNKLNLFSENQ